MFERAILAVNLINDRAKKSRDYGTGDLLFHAEVHMLVAIGNHPNANASELARKLGITSGAVTQVVKKLTRKKLVEKYQRAENRKEVFFRLTPKGARAHAGHERAEKQLFGALIDYVNGRSPRELQAIERFFDHLVQCLKSG